LSKSVKLNNDTYIDSQSISFNRTKLSTLLDILRIHTSVTYSSMNDFLTAYQSFANYRIHIGYANIENTNCCFLGFNQIYQNRNYARVIILNAWHSYMAYISGGTAWTIKEINLS